MLYEFSVLFVCIFSYLPLSLFLFILDVILPILGNNLTSSSLPRDELLQDVSS